MTGLQFAGWLALAYVAGMATAVGVDCIAQRKAKRRGVAP